MIIPAQNLGHPYFCVESRFCFRVVDIVRLPLKTELHPGIGAPIPAPMDIVVLLYPSTPAPAIASISIGAGSIIRQAIILLLHAAQLQLLASGNDNYGQWVPHLSTVERGINRVFPCYGYYSHALSLNPLLNSSNLIRTRTDVFTRCSPNIVAMSALDVLLAKIISSVRSVAAKNETKLVILASLLLG